MKSMPALPDADKWAAMPFIAQMANIGSEVGRTAKWVAKEKYNLAEGAFIRALDLYDLTIRYGRRGQEGRVDMLKELCRCRDEFAAAYMNRDVDSLTWLEKYFSFFAVAYSKGYRV